MTIFGAAFSQQCFVLAPELVSALVQADTPQQVTALLGLDRRGRVLARDQALCEAVAVMGGCDDTWDFSFTLAPAVKRFKTGQWPHLQAGWRPADLGPLNTALHKAFASGALVPCTQRRLWDWLKLRY